MRRSKLYNVKASKCWSCSNFRNICMYNVHTLHNVCIKIRKELVFEGKFVFWQQVQCYYPVSASISGDARCIVTMVTTLGPVNTSNRGG